MMSGTNGPPLSMVYYDTPGRPDIPVVRKAIGREMERFDVLLDDGWRDFAQLDKTTMQLVKLDLPYPPLGTASFNRIAANRDCRECHKSIRRKPFQFGVGAKLGPIELSIGNPPRGNIPPQQPSSRPPAAITPSARGPAGPTGPQGPAGLEGPQGPKGNPGKDADTDVISDALTRWMDENKEGLRPRVDYAELAKHVKIPELDIDSITAEIVKRLPPGKISQADIERVVELVEADLMDQAEAAVADLKKTIGGLNERIAILESRKPQDIDYDEIARRVKIPAGENVDVDLMMAELLRKLPPLYIGAKDINGKITMPATPVKLGQDVFIQIDPPSLNPPK